MPEVSRKAAIALAASASIALFATACTGQSNSGANDDASKETTINFWHAWSAPNEVAAVKSLIAGFEHAHPNIHVNVVGNMTDDKINQALRSGGDKAPDVISSFTTNNVGKFCSSGALIDLNPFFKKAGIDPQATFPKAMNEYTQFDGNRCTVPLLGDAYGLYYNKTAFAKAGIKNPPKTWSEFEADAKKLTIPQGDGYKQLGFMPDYHGWETTTEHYFAQFSPTYFDSSGKSNLAKDPAFEKGFILQKKLVDELGGFQKLEKYRATLGDEWPQAPLPHRPGGHAARRRVAAGHGGGRQAEVRHRRRPAARPGRPGKPVRQGLHHRHHRRHRRHQPQAERGLGVRQVHHHGHRRRRRFANDIHNVPSTLAALKSPKLKYDPRFKTFLDIAANPDSTTSPASINGGQYLVTIQQFGYDYESGKAKDLKAGLAKTAQQIDTDIAQAK